MLLIEEELNIHQLYLTMMQILLRPKFFTSLRIEKQLAYKLDVGFEILNNQLVLYFIIDSSKLDKDQGVKEIQLFLTDVAKNIDELTEENYVDLLITACNQIKTKLSSKDKMYLLFK